MLALKLGLLHLLLDIHLLHSVSHICPVLLFSARARRGILLLGVCFPIASLLTSYVCSFLAFTIHVIHRSIIHAIEFMLLLRRNIQGICLVLVVLLHLFSVDHGSLF